MSNVISLKSYRMWVEATIRILKRKYNNLSAEDAHKMSSDIADAIAEIEEQRAELEALKQPERLKDPRFLAGMCPYKEGLIQCVLTAGHEERAGTPHTDAEGVQMGVSK